MNKNELMPNDYLIAQGLVFRSELAFAGVAAAGFAYLGVTTGADEVVVLQRAFSSSEQVLTAELFEATWSGGTDPRTLNRRLSIGGTPPGTVKVGVTPGTLGAVITGNTLRSPSTTGSSSLAVTGDESRIYLKANTSYVIRFTNGGAGAATIGFAFDYRKALAGNWERTIGSA